MLESMDRGGGEACEYPIGVLDVEGAGDMHCLFRRGEFLPVVIARIHVREHAAQFQSGRAPAQSLSLRMRRSEGALAAVLCGIQEGFDYCMAFHTVRIYVRVRSCIPRTGYVVEGFGVRRVVLSVPSGFCYELESTAS